MLRAYRVSVPGNTQVCMYDMCAFRFGRTLKVLPSRKSKPIRILLIVSYVSLFLILTKYYQYAYRSVVLGIQNYGSISVLVCPAEERLSRAPPDPPQPHPLASTRPGTPRCNQRKSGRQRRTRRAGSTERSPPGDGLLDLRYAGGS